MISGQKEWGAYVARTSRVRHVAIIDNMEFEKLGRVDVV
jgi:hypothetical protein